MKFNETRVTDGDFKKLIEFQKILLGLPDAIAAVKAQCEANAKTIETLSKRIDRELSAICRKVGEAHKNSSRALSKSDMKNVREEIDYLVNKNFRENLQRMAQVNGLLLRINESNAVNEVNYGSLIQIGLQIHDIGLRLSAIEKASEGS